MKGMRIGIPVGYYDTDIEDDVLTVMEAIRTNSEQRWNAHEKNGPTEMLAHAR